ncbi:MAG: NAD-dependent DNA ligase LigA, partial [Ignavibacteriaceae bacterium]|nr:NAD-dependent DNA ligase LigA [Ignavibacteriaceae bacterium]
IGIRYVGAGAAKKLADHFVSLERLMQAGEAEITEVYEIGEAIARSVVKFFSDGHNLHLVSDLREFGLQLEGEQKKVAVDNFFKNKSFVLTGTLSSMKREEAAERITNLGGKSVSSVSKNTDFVIAGESAGSKLDKAQKLGVGILTEEEFLEKLLSAEKL